MLNHSSVIKSFKETLSGIVFYNIIFRKICLFQ